MKAIDSAMQVRRPVFRVVRDAWIPRIRHFCERFGAAAVISYRERVPF
jgi:hypothetical protein